MTENTPFPCTSPDWSGNDGCCGRCGFARTSHPETPTPAQLRALRTILAHGGNVVVTMGRLQGAYVNKLVARKLVEFGFAEWGSAEEAYEQQHAGHIAVQIFATAKGCLAVHAAEVSVEA